MSDPDEMQEIEDVIDGLWGLAADTESAEAKKRLLLQKAATYVADFLSLRTKEMSCGIPQINHDGFVLECTHCASHKLHQTRVVSMFRHFDDGPGDILASERTKYQVERDVIDLPERRDTVDIHFYCENCPDVSTLRILQHKGLTFVNWVTEDDKYATKYKIKNPRQD